MRAYNLAFSFAQIAQQILDKVDRDVDEAEQLTKKENGELIPKSIN